MTLNIYKVEHGKPMVYSLHSAKVFQEQTKHPIEIHNQDMKSGMYLIIHNDKLQIVERCYCGDFGVDTEMYISIGEQCIRDIYKLRKYINYHFNRG